MADSNPDLTRRSSPAFFAGLALLLFAASTYSTIREIAKMSLPDGVAPSMMWMPMADQSWIGTAAAFVFMWVVMMLVMMLPSFAPALWRFLKNTDTRRGTERETAALMVFAGYFGVWAALGGLVFGLGAGLNAVAMSEPGWARAMPFLAAAVVLIAGALQFTGWKAHQLACCRQIPGYLGTSSRDVIGSFRSGMRFGLHCTKCCAGSTAILLILGLMNLKLMGLVTLLITLERTLPGGLRFARAAGVLTLGAGLVLLQRALATV